MLSIAPEAIAPVSVPLATPALGGPPELVPLVLDVLLFDEHAASRRAAAVTAMPPRRKCFLAIDSPILTALIRSVHLSVFGPRSAE